MAAASALNTDRLIAENIFLSIGQKDILSGATISAGKGAITGLLGRNGAGKSTMLQCMFGTLSAQECDVFAKGKKIKRPYLVDGLMNYLPQKSFMPGGLTFRHISRNFGVDEREIYTRFPELEADGNKKIRELSGGTERLFAVLLLLLADTRFTLLDEPFSHIMPLHIERLTALLVQQKQKKGIIITDHMYRHLLQVSDTVYLMKQGKSIFMKSREDLELHGYLSDSMFV